MAESEVAKEFAAGLPSQPAIKVVTVESGGPGVTSTIPPAVEAPSGPGISENPGVVSSALVAETEVPASPVSEALRTLRSEMANLRDMGGTDGTPRTLAIGWRTDRSLVEGERDHTYVSRYSTVGSLGIMQHYPMYVAAAGQAVDMAIINHDMDIRWHARSGTEAAGHRTTLSEWVLKAFSATEDSLGMISNLARMRGYYFEGKVALSLSELLVSRQSQGGYSALEALIKIHGYMLSLGLPADDGLLGFASIACNAPLQVGGMYFPGEAAPYAAGGAIPTYFITLNLWNQVLHGQAPLPHNFRVADIGSRIAVVPAPLSKLGMGTALAATVLGQLAYPVKNIVRQGPIRDWDGILTDGAVPPVNRNANWFPTSTLVSVDGIVGSANANQAMVIFVMVEDYAMAGPWPSIDIPGTGQLTLINAWPAAAAVIPDFQLFLANMFAVAQLDTLLGVLYNAQDIIIKYWGGSIDVHDSISFWQTAVTVFRPGTELSSSVQRATVLSPTFSADRGWVTREDALYPTQAFNACQSTIGLAINACGMWPSAVFNPATGLAVTAPNKVQWFVPTMDPVMVIGMSAGLLAVAVPPEGQFGVTLKELLRTVVHGSFLVACACDLMWASNAASRSLLWVQQRLPYNINTCAQIRYRQDEFWGRRGQPVTEGLSFSGLMSKYIFEGRVICDYPANGVVIPGGAAYPQGFGPGWHLLARIDLPTLAMYIPSLPPISDTVDINLRQFSDKYVLETRNPQRNRRDVGLLLPDTSTDQWSYAWALSSTIDGIGANQLGYLIYRSLQHVAVDTLQVRNALSINRYSPFTWGGLMSLGDSAVVQGLIGFSPSSWTLSVGRPLGSYDPGFNVRMALIVLDASLARSQGRHERSKVAYNIQVGTTPYDAWGPESTGFVKKWRALVL